MNVGSNEGNGKLQPAMRGLLHKAKRWGDGESEQGMRGTLNEQKVREMVNVTRGERGSLLPVNDLVNGT